MIVFLTLIYVALLGVLVWMGKVPNSAKTWFTVPIWMVLLLIFLFFPMQLGAPSGPIRILTYSVSIIPNVAGTVTEVVAEESEPLKEGDVLFEIDPRPFRYLLEAKTAALAESEQVALQLVEGVNQASAAVEEARATRDRARDNYDRYRTANENARQSGRTGATPFTESEVEQRRLTYLASEAGLKRAEAAEKQARLAATSEIDGVNTTVARLRAEVEKAAYDLEQTTVRAPSDGYAAFIALRPGQRVVTFPFSPAMTYIDTSQTLVLAQVGQIYLRNIEPGQPVELAFKTHAGKIYEGVVDRVLQVSGQGQEQAGGTVPLPQQIQALPFYVGIILKDEEAARALPAGTVGTAAIYTETATATHIIRKVMIRMESFLNYIVPTM